MGRSVLLGALVLGLAPGGAGCVALGWQFGPGFSSTDRGVFAGAPVILHGDICGLRDAVRSRDIPCVEKGPEYALSWTYGEAGFFFQPSCRASEGKLVCVLQGTSSSGSLRGRKGVTPISRPEEVIALEAGGAWWWESTGARTRLAIVDVTPRQPPPRRDAPTPLRE